MKALLTTAAIILTATFATAEKFDTDRFDVDKMELVSNIEDRLTIHQEADGIEFTHFKADESLLVKKGHIALVIQSYLEKLNVIYVYAMNPDAEYEFVEMIHTNIPATDVQKYAVEFFVNGQESFIERYSIVAPGTNKSQPENVDRKPLELKLKTLEEEQAEWESEEGEEGE